MPGTVISAARAPGSPLADVKREAHLDRLWRSKMATRQADNTIQETGKGHGTKALGPSNSSDSGSDVAHGGAGELLGDTDLDADTDAQGTGERAAAGRDDSQPSGRDVRTDREARADDPSLGLTDGPQRADGTSIESDVERAGGPERDGS
jgi:hypothetical protein